MTRRFSLLPAARAGRLTPEQAAILDLQSDLADLRAWQRQVEADRDLAAPLPVFRSCRSRSVVLFFSRRVA
ncbi:hypothetical protein [Pseudogemmobacter humi]|uniref:Uncharacterized protein n=1 Tax=Pseudogemmobacter humi TaxID=2483812 RepID=A0A3P5XAE7_9RHOB|nr:hypothetical protein [Pseudogemmobacter humi]VDC28240.1 hypothetical protein XINFAN_02016 [Pseudogemmobacter humi]